LEWPPVLALVADGEFSAPRQTDRLRTVDRCNLEAVRGRYFGPPPFRVSSCEMPVTNSVLRPPSSALRPSEVAVANLTFDHTKPRSAQMRPVCEQLIRRRYQIPNDLRQETTRRHCRFCDGSEPNFLDSWVLKAVVRNGFRPSELRVASSPLTIPSSVLRPPSSIRCPPSSVLRPPSSVLRPSDQEPETPWTILHRTTVPSKTPSRTKDRSRCSCASPPLRG
jgi:hypothetical protein